MSNYTKLTDFAAKDALLTGNPSKIVRGSEIDDEYNAIQIAVATKQNATDTLAIAYGGTGATSASAARTALGLAIGTNIPAPTGTGASGSWAIDITGNAATATNATNADNVTGTIGSAVTATTQTAGDSSTKVATTAFVATATTNATVVFRSYLAGLTLSTAGSSATMSIAAGQASNSTNAAMMSLTAIAKTTSAWSVGTAAGGLDTGTIANSTWYYFYVIRRPDTGVVDVVFSLSSSAPTLPTNYTQYRYIGGARTNGSAQWTKFIQYGDIFNWDAPVLEFNAAGSATARLLTCTVPVGRKVHVRFNVKTAASTAPGMVLLSDPDIADAAPSSTASPLADTFSGTGSSLNGNRTDCLTNTSAQVRHREADTTAFHLVTLGWTDLRGKDL